jgi:hypothetical protein
MYTVVRGLELAAAVDVLFMLVKIPRQALWSNMPVPAINAAQRIRRNREVIWGKPGHATDKQGATFSSKLSARLFEYRVHIEHPNNGMLYNVAQAAVGPHYRGPGYHVLSRYDVPSLAQIYPDIGVYNNEVQLDLRSFGWDVANYRYVQGAMAPDNPASNEILAPLAVENRFTNLQELVAAFKRMGPFANAAMVNMIGDPMPFYRRFKIVDSHNVGTRSYMSGDVSGPLTWASLLSYGTAEEIQAYLDYPAPQDVPLSFMHPWCGVDWRDNVELKLAITFDSPIRRTLQDARRWRIILSDTLSADPYSLMSLPGVGDRVYPDIDF